MSTAEPSLSSKSVKEKKKSCPSFEGKEKGRKEKHRATSRLATDSCHCLPPTVSKLTGKSGNCLKAVGREPNHHSGVLEDWSRYLGRLVPSEKHLGSGRNLV